MSVPRSSTGRGTSVKLNAPKPSEDSSNGAFQSLTDEKVIRSSDVPNRSPEAPPKPPRHRNNGLARLSFRSSESYHMSFKVMLIGDSGVGKTCFLIRYKDRSFLSGAYISTVGIDFRNKIMNVDSTRVKLQVWDTAGQERFRSVTQAYYRDAHAVMVIYDVTKIESFQHAIGWLNDVKKFGNENVVPMLIGNKADVSSGRQVTTDDGKKLAEENGLLFMETSAKTGKNVDQAFVQVTRILISRQEGKPKDRSFDISQPETEDDNRKFGCCGAQ